MACTQLKLQQAPPMCGAYSLGERSGSQGACGGLTNREDDAGLQALQCGLQIRRAAGDLLVRRTTVPRWSTADHVGADVEVYLGEYRRFLRWCEDQAREPTFDTLLDYRAGLDNITVKSKTRYRRGISIAAVVWAAFQREIPPPSPASSVSRYTVKTRHQVGAAAPRRLPVPGWGSGLWRWAYRS